ncbi:MAG: hypothetical protein ABIP64_09160 [Burkholderiales bacterium]
MSTAPHARYASHHIVDPGVVLAEMVRVCKPGGCVMVIDSAPEISRADSFNSSELIRDPCHTRVLPAEELTYLISHAGLTISTRKLYAWEVPAQGLIERSFPLPANKFGRVTSRM